MAPYQQKRLDDIVNQLLPYKKLKDEHGEQLKQARLIGQPEWQIHSMEIEFSKEQMESEERAVFSKLASEAKSNPHFERYFRSAFLKVFLGIHLEPTSILIPVPGSNGKHFT